MISKVELKRVFIRFGDDLTHMICIPIGGKKMHLRDIKPSAQCIDILNKLEFVNTISP